MNEAYIDTNLNFKQKLCFASIWLIAIYSSVIQQKYFQIPSGMLILGIVLLFTFLLANNKTPIYLKELVPKEEKLQLLFLIYMLIIGSACAVSFDAHISQLINTTEYFVVMVLAAYMIRKTGSDSVQYMLLVIGILVSLILIFDPVNLGNGRYSLSITSNPNGVGMSMATGIWSILYLQKKKNIPLIIAFAVVYLLGYGILLTGSRKSLIAAGLTVLLWVFFVYIPSLKRENIIKSIFMLLSITVIIFVVVSLFMKEYGDSVLAIRMQNLQYEATEGARSQFYRDGIELFKNNPLFGVGFQGFKFFYIKYSHSTFVEVPVSGGIIGAIIYFMSFFCSIKKIIQLIKNTSDEVKRNMDLRMLLVLWAVILFYCICVIHPYQLESFILFAIIFGQTGAIEEVSYQRRNQSV